MDDLTIATLTFFIGLIGNLIVDMAYQIIKESESDA